jgi:hypothetical protein
VQNSSFTTREFAREKDALALKVMELQDLLDSAHASLQEIKVKRENEEQEVLFASMAVEEMIAKLDENCSSPQVRCVYEQ